MLIQKICEYLTEIGLLNLDGIDTFLKINSSLSDKQFNNDTEKIQYTLYIYLKQIFRYDKIILKLSEDVINSYLNSQLVNKFQKIRNFCSLLQNKLIFLYNKFFSKLSIFLIKKDNTICFKILTKPDNNSLNENKKCYSSNDIHKKLNGKHETKIKVKRNYKKIINYKSKNNNKRVINNKNTYNKKVICCSKHRFTNSFNTLTNKNNDINLLSPYYNLSKSPISNNLKNIFENTFQYSQQLTIPYNFSQFAINNNFFNPTNNFCISKNNSGNYISYYDFFDNEEKHVKKVQSKIMNLKMQKLNQFEEECTFNPKINSYNPSKFRFSDNNLNNDYIKISSIKSSNQNIIRHLSPYEKLYKDSKINKLKRDERIRHYLCGFSFTPKIENNEKYKVSSTFEERRLKSIEIKNKLKQKKEEEDLKIKEMSNSNKKGNKFNEKEIVKRLYGKEAEKIKEKLKKEKKIKEIEEKKKHVINWKKVYKEYNEKYPEGDDYKKQLEKRKKLFQKYNEKRQKEEEKGNIKDFQDFLKTKKENNNENEFKEVENVINNAFQSTSLKALLSKENEKEGNLLKDQI